MTKHFTLAEFEAVSHRALTMNEETRARLHAETLELIRPFVGPICLTSYVRTGAAIGAGPHADGRGLDFVPCNRDRQHMARIHAALAFIARIKYAVTGEWVYGELLLEEDHIHMSLPGTDPKGDGQTLIQTSEGPQGRTWITGTVWTGLITVLFAVVVFGFAGWQFYKIGL